MQITVQYKPITYRAKFLHTEIFKDLIKASTFNDTTKWERLIPVVDYSEPQCVMVNGEFLHSDVYVDEYETDQDELGRVYNNYAMRCGQCNEWVEWQDCLL